MADHGTHENEEDLYELLGQDALAWLRQAEFLRMSAALVWEKFSEIHPLSQVQPGIGQQKVAFSQSFMLLMGMSFENLIKGADVAKTPGLSIKERRQRWDSYRGGHGISGLITLVASTSAKEKNLLRRMEEYVMWAGRYPIPRNTDQYRKAKDFRSLSYPQDQLLCDTLFERLASLIRTIIST
jgi:hypothetical protein